jgi:membrane-bound lytic murein transglycosylase B
MFVFLELSAQYSENPDTCGWKEYLASVFSDPRLKIDSGIVGILNAKSHEPNYSFLYKESSLMRGDSFLVKNKVILDSAYDRYGVDKYYLAAIMRIETDFGANLGNYSVMNALYTICTCSHSESRSVNAAKEIRRFLDLCRKYKWDPFSIKGSWAGAFGIPQFMPSSFGYVVDGNSDGIVNLFNMDDAIMSAANFLHENGWEKSYKSSWKKALRKYNKGSYGAAVIKYAELLRKRH